MTKPTLAELYAAHTGKVSDKWTSYLPTYDRMFAHLRDQPISLLEIGVQNGGSLEIWAKYFPAAKNIVGLDVNPQCLTLQYQDPRIWVAIGDAADKGTEIPAGRGAGGFDIIIDDGSHKPSDQLDALRNWWPSLKSGGVYIVEDLHCEQGDITVKTFFELFALRLATDSRLVSDDTSRIEFTNSMIAVIKGSGDLGPRVVTGREQQICPVLHLNGEVRRG